MSSSVHTSIEALVRRADYDRYASALFAPPDSRPHLFALYAFNYEVAKTAESVSQPLAGQIRLQWWRDAIDELYHGRVRAHEVVQALAETIATHTLPREAFDTLIDAHEHDLEETPFADMDALIAYCDGTSGALMRLALRVLGAGDAFDIPARDAGIAYALTGLLRVLPFHAARRRLMLPAEGLAPNDIFAGRSSAALTTRIAEVAALARLHKKKVATIPRRYLPALLPAAVVPKYLSGMTSRGFNPFRDIVEVPVYRRQLALLGAMVRGRV